MSPPRVSELVWPAFAVGCLILAAAGLWTLLSRAAVPPVATPAPPPVADAEKPLESKRDVSPLPPGLVRDSAGNPIAFEGRVLNPAGEPVAKATVRVRASPSFVVSDAEGRFRLPLTSADVEIAVFKEGYLIAGAAAATSPNVIRLEALPATDDPNYAWVSPHPNAKDEKACGNCHQAIYQEWVGSSHGRSATNRRFISLLEGTDWNGKPDVGWSVKRNNPHGVGVCTSCHGPTVKATDPAFMDLKLAKGVAADGVHCDLCHKVQGTTTEDKFGITHGIHGLDLLRPSSGQILFGPWDDVTRGEDVFSPLYSQSRYCASCHEGTVFGAKVYTTYTEWLASPARQQGKECQDCHMPSPGSRTNVAPGHGGLERDPARLSRHDFPGADLKMLQQALTLKAEIRRDARFGPDGLPPLVLSCELSAAGAGHSVPTGAADRNVLLVAEPFDAQDQPLDTKEAYFLDGGLWGDVGPELEGKPVQLYAKVWQDRVSRPNPFWWETGYEVVDTRLDPAKPRQEKMVLPEGTARVRVRVIYRRFWPKVEIEKGWPRQEIVVFDRSIKVADEKAAN